MGLSDGFSVRKLEANFINTIMFCYNCKAIPVYYMFDSKVCLLLASSAGQTGYTLDAAVKYSAGKLG